MGKLSNLLGVTVGACALVTLLAVGVLRIEVQPAFLLIRNIFIAALGGQAPGLSYGGAGDGNTLKCDFDSGVCEAKP
jgi:hypothetical protein